MLPSSTSSSDRAATPHRRWRSFALVVLIALAVAEAALRFHEVRAMLPPRTHYFHSFIPRRLAALERLTSVYDRIDVLFVGSSIVMTNVHPLLFDTIVGSEQGRVVSFNIGMPGIWPATVSLYLEHVWMPTARPRMVVQGIRYAELAATGDAKQTTPVWTGRVEAAWRESDVVTRLYAAAVRHVHLLQYRGAWNSTLERFRNGWVGTTAGDDLGFVLHGYEPRPAGLADVSRWEEDLPNEGTCGCAKGFAALRRTIAIARAAGAAYVLVNVPEDAMRWRGPTAPERYRAYVAALREFAASEGVAFVDPTAGRLGYVPHPLFNDFAHMTAEGSRQFTRALAERMRPLVADLPGDRPRRQLALHGAALATVPR
jgi:hypothetical protein